MPTWAPQRDLVSPLTEVSRAFEDSGLQKDADTFPDAALRQQSQSAYVSHHQYSPSRASRPESTSPHRTASPLYEPPLFSDVQSTQQHHSSSVPRTAQMRGPRYPPSIPPPKTGPRAETVVIHMENGGLVEVPVQPNSLGCDVKKEIQFREAVDEKRQRLWLADGSEVDNFSTLRSVGIENGAHLRVSVQPPPRSSQAAPPPELAPFVSQPFEVRVNRLNTSEPLKILFEGDNLTVKEVLPDGAAARAGVVPGMVVLSVNDEHVESFLDLKRAVACGPADVSLIVTHEQRVAPSEDPVREGSMPTNQQLMANVEREVARDAVVWQQSLTWIVHRLCLWFFIALTIVSGFILLVIAAEDGGSPCTVINRWAIAACVLLLVGGFAACLGAAHFQSSGRQVFNPADFQSVVFITFFSLLVFTDGLLAIIGLVILTRSLSREDRDECQSHRDMVIFMVIALCFVATVLLIMYCTKLTYTRDIAARHKRHKEERAALIGIPSVQPKDYLRDSSNPKVPGRYV